jgi:endonuclease YncB( thermonuclease family)
MLASALFACLVVTVTDGDTFTCHRGPNIRLQGADAPEMKGCRGRRGRICVPGDLIASQRHLAGMILGKTLSCRRTGKSYGRVTAWCGLGAVDLSCAQVRAGYAVRVARYDRAGRLLRCAR